MLSCLLSSTYNVLLSGCTLELNVRSLMQQTCCTYDVTPQSCLSGCQEKSCQKHTSWPYLFPGRLSADFGGGKRSRQASEVWLLVILGATAVIEQDSYSICFKFATASWRSFFSLKSLSY